MCAGTLKSIVIYLVMNNCDEPAESVMESVIAGLNFYFFFYPDLPETLTFCFGVL